MSNSDSLIPPRMLFRFRVPCRRLVGPLWTPKKGVQLGEEYRLPNLAELDGKASFADLRVAWSDQGLAVNLRVEGKRQPPWCRVSQPDVSDGLQLWLDTRDTQTIHRASRFCHRFAFMPTGEGAKRDEATCHQLVIHRAKDQARPVQPGQLAARSVVSATGYLLEAAIASAALWGFDPEEHPRLGFTYLVQDRERGPQSFSVGAEFPYEEDPSLWGSLELTRD